MAFRFDLILSRSCNQCDDANEAELIRWGGKGKGMMVEETQLWRVPSRMHCALASNVPMPSAGHLQ